MKSIMHKKDGTCYLCMKLEDNYYPQLVTQEHHVIFGTSNRRLSERYGLKVYLCVAHHLTGPNAVHRNNAVREMLCRDAQEQFEREYPNISFRNIFGKNWKAHKDLVKKPIETTEKGFMIIDGDD